MTPEEFQAEIDKNTADNNSQENDQAEIRAITKAGIKNVEATNANTQSTAAALRDIKGEVKITNPDLAKTGDVASAVDAINKMNLTAFVASQDKYTQMAQNMLTLSQELKTVAESIQGNGKTLDSTLSGSIDKITAISDKLSSVNITSNKDIQKVLNEVLKAVQAIDIKPQVTVDSPTVNVPTPKVTVTGTEVDLAPLRDLLEEIKTAVSNDAKEPDFTEVTQAVNSVQSAINNLTFPVANYVLPFKDVDGKAVQVQLDASGNLPVAGGSGGGSTQYTDGSSTVAHPIGTIPVFDKTGTITAVSLSNPLPIIGTQGTAAAITAGWPIIGGELVDVTGTFTNGTQTTSVTSSNFDGYSTVIVSINGTYGTATGVFELSDDNGTTWYSVNAARSDGSAIETGYTSLTNTNRMWTLSVSGADQFRVRSTAVASGTVNVRISTEALPTPEAASVTIPGSVTVTGSATGSAVPAGAFYIGINNGGNLASPLTTADSGDGVSTTSSALLFRTTAEGYSFNGTNWDRNRTANGASNTTGTGLLGIGNLVFDGTNYQRQTVNSTTTTSKFGADTNILSVLGTAPTTAGKLDVKGADGDVFVRQTTAANLNATVRNQDGSGNNLTSVGGSLTVVQSATTGALTQVNSSATSVTVLASNANRKGATFYNNSTQILYLAFGSTATTSAYTVPLASNAFFEMPSGYTGIVSGIWASANGNCQVTEIT